MSTGESKACSKCGEIKPLTDFYAHKECRNGRRPECKLCFNTAKAMRRLANLERARQYDRERYANDPARKAAQKVNAIAHAAANRDHRRAVQRAYYYANKDKHSEWAAKRRAIKRGVEHQPYTRREIYDRDDGHCRICGVALPYEPNGFSLDHIVPLVLGGPDTPANLQLTCQPCNRRKAANLVGQIHLPV
jgi:5-methylcytosine-specific restriction endonuclease McrA